MIPRRRRSRDFLWKKILFFTDVYHRNCFLEQNCNFISEAKFMNCDLRLRTTTRELVSFNVFMAGQML